MDTPFKTTFAAQIRAIEPSDTERQEAKASLTDLKALLPEGINPDDDPQLLYISANLYVAGMVNKNDDGVDIETALATYKGFEKQQLNIEHDRGRVAGYILHAGLSEFGTDRLITEDEARTVGRPFNVAVAAVLWKVNNPKLCSYITEASNPLHPDYKTLSLSFEVGFSSYDIAVIDSETRVVSEAKATYRPADADYETMAKKLRTNGGSGRPAVDSTDGIYQILTGTFIPLGGGIVTAPAAAVRGITAITEPVVSQVDENAADCEEFEVEDDNTEAAAIEIAAQTAREQMTIARAEMKADLARLMRLFEKKSLSHIISTETRVSPITSTTIQSYMSKTLLQQMKEKVASAEKPEDMKQVFAGVMEIADAIVQKSEELSAQLDAEKNRGAAIEAARAEAAAASDELKKTLDLVRAELDAIHATQAAAAAETQFNERMATIDEEFELADEERALLVDEVKPLDEAGFGTWMARAKKLMKEKTKSFKKQQKDDKQKKTDEMCAALKAKGITVTIDENDLFKEIIASAQANNVSAPIENVIETAGKTLAERAKTEFLENASIGGKKLSEYSK